MPVISTVRRDRAKKVAIASCVGLCVAVGLFVFHSPATGIMLAIVSGAASSVANLIND